MKRSLRCRCVRRKAKIDRLCENTLTDVRAQAIMIAVRTYNRQKAKEVA